MVVKKKAVKKKAVKKKVEFAEKKEIKKPSVGYNKNAVGITIDKAETDIIENPSDFFGKNSQDSVVDMVLYMRKIDPMLGGFSQTRKNAVLSHKREIIGTGAETDFIRSVFSGFNNFHGTLSQILNSIDVGYAVPELVWEVVDGKYVITKILPRHQGKFKFDEFGQTWLVTEDAEKKVDDIKFPVFTFQEEFGNRYGSGMYQSLYYYWFIKKQAVKFWSIFTERFAVPVIVAELPDGLSDEDENDIKAFIKDFKSATNISLPKDVVLRFLEAEQSGSVENFDSFMNFLNKSMAIFYLGQTDTSGVDNTSGSYARAKVQNQVREDITLSDIMLLENFINDMIIKPLINLNFPNVTEYPKWRVIIPISISTEMIKQLVESGNKYIPVWWVNERFGIPTKDNLSKDEMMIVETVSNTGFKETNFKEQKEDYMKKLNEIVEGKK